MYRYLKSQICSIFVAVGVVACSSSELNASNGICQSTPFKGGIQLTLPLTPLSIQIDSDGVDFILENSLSIDLFVIQLEPYITFDSPGNPVSSCLKVEIKNPEWDSRYRRFYVNFNKDNILRVRVRTEDYTEFVFSKERWIANPPGEQAFVRYEYNTNTLFLDASNGRVEEFQILAERPEAKEKYSFCVSELEDRRNGVFTNPFVYIFAHFQDFVNTTREVILGKFGPSIGGIAILFFGLIGILWSLAPLRKAKEQVSRNWVVGRFVFWIVWPFFWLIVFFAIPACWG